MESRGPASLPVLSPLPNFSSQEEEKGPRHTRRPLGRHLPPCSLNDMDCNLKPRTKINFSSPTFLPVRSVTAVAREVSSTPHTPMQWLFLKGGRVTGRRKTATVTPPKQQGYPLPRKDRPSLADSDKLPGSHTLGRATPTWIVLPIHNSHPASEKSQIIKRKENLNGTELWKITFISCDHLKMLGRETLSH